MVKVPDEAMKAIAEARGPLGLELIAPGVAGYGVQTKEAIYFPVIEALHPGNGDVGRWLDSLPTDRTIRIPDVLNPKLRGMLERRGYVPVFEYAEEFEEDVEVMERKAKVSGEV